MNAAHKLAILILGAILLLLPAHGSVLADQIKAQVVSAGAVTTPSGSLLNVGQTAIGSARSATHGMKGGVIPVIISLSSPQSRGDLDGDGDVDLDDEAVFAACLNGPNVTSPPNGCTQEQFDLADLHVDRDVDLRDFQFFLDAISTDWSIQ